MNRLLGNITDPEESRLRLSIDPAKLDYSEDLLIMWMHLERIDDLRQYLNGEYRHIAYSSTEHILKGLLREDLILQSEIRERVDQFRRERFNPTISVCMSVIPTGNSSSPKSLESSNQFSSAYLLAKSSCDGQ